MSCCNNCNTNPCCCASPLRYKGPDIDCLGISNCTAYDSIFQTLANEICDLNTTIENINGVDHVSFTSSTGTPSNVPNQPCETDTYTLWGDLAETINLGSFSITNPCDLTLNYANVAWVDLYFGDDTTGQAGRFDLPFTTISAALAASQHVYLRQGAYTESFEMVDGMVVYAEPGVEFRQGGIWYNDETVISGSFLGYARFIADSIPVDLLNAGNLRFECDYIDNEQSVFYVAGNASLVASVKYIRCSGRRSAFINSFRDTANVELHIQEFCEGPHSPYFFRGQNIKTFSGVAKIVCPISRTIDAGPYGPIRKSVLNIDSNSDGSVELVGNLETATTVSDITDAGCVRYVSNFFTNTVVSIDGDIKGGPEIGIYNGFVGDNMDFTLKGNIISEINPITIQNFNRPAVAITLRFFNSIIQGGQTTLIGQGIQSYFYNCSFYNSSTNLDVIDVNDTGTDNTTLYFYNCVGEATGVANFISDNSIGFFLTTGLATSNANSPLGVGVVDTWGGFTQIASIIVPKL